jgi:hypothetical protein
MRKEISNFWWRVEDGKKKFHWRSWKWLSSPKYLGGMGFRDFAMFNQPMLAKQGWWLLTELNSLCAQVLKGIKRTLLPQWRLLDNPMPKIILIHMEKYNAWQEVA